MPSGSYELREASPSFSGGGGVAVVGEDDTGSLGRGRRRRRDRIHRPSGSALGKVIVGTNVVVFVSLLLPLIYVIYIYILLRKHLNVIRENIFPMYFKKLKHASIIALL